MENRTPANPQWVKLNLFAFCLLTVLSLTGFIANSTYAQSFPNFSNGGGGDWSAGYYRSLSVTNSTDSALTDYQIKVTLTTAALGNPYTNIKPDGSDIRFTASDKSTEIPCWIESFSNTGTSTIWVKVPNLPASDSCIYMYYGNPSATSGSNGTDTFEFFDDFEDGNVSDWTQTNKATLKLTAIQTPVKQGVYSGKIAEKSKGGAFAYKQIPELANGDRVIEWWWRPIVTNKYVYIYIVPTAEQASNAIALYFASDGNLKYYDGAWSTNIMPYEANKWYENRILIKKGATDSTFDWWIDGVKKVTEGSTCGTVTSAIYFQPMIGTSSANYADHYIDTVRVRKYVSPEPSMTTPGKRTPITNYILLADPTNLVKDKSGVKIGETIPHLKFNLQLVNYANSEQKTAHWKRLRIDKYVPTRYARMAIPDDKIEVSVWVEGNNNGVWDMKDTLISKGKFKDGKVWLDMNRYEITTMPKTFYIVYKIAQDTAIGQRAGVEVKEPSYLEFEEQDICMSSQNF